MSTEFNPMEGLLADLLNTWDDEPALDSGLETATDSLEGDAPAVEFAETASIMATEPTVAETMVAEATVAEEPAQTLTEPEPAPAPRLPQQPVMVAESLTSHYVPELPSASTSELPYGPQRPRSSRAHEPVPFISALLKTATREPAPTREPSPLDTILVPQPPAVQAPERFIPQISEPQATVVELAALPEVAALPPAPEIVAETPVELPAITWAEDPGAAASCAAILARMEREFAEREPIYPPARKRLASDVPRYVIFVLREMVFAIPIGRVLETDRLTPITPLPGAAPGVKGLTNLRGEVVPVIDLREMLGWAPPENPAARRMLVINDGHRQPLAALLVDQVKGLAAFPATAWKAAEIAGAHSVEGFVEAVAERESDWVSRLNLDRILNETHLPSLAAA